MLFGRAVNAEDSTIRACKPVGSFNIRRPPFMSTSTPQVKRISPMLVVADMETTLNFYVKVLGFEILLRSPAYSIVSRDGATIHFMKAANEAVMKAVRGHTDIYIEVADIAPLWEQVSRFRKDYRIRDLFDRNYGMREFHISDPNDCLVFVGQKI